MTAHSFLSTHRTTWDHRCTLIALPPRAPLGGRTPEIDRGFKGTYVVRAQLLQPGIKPQDVAVKYAHGPVAVARLCYEAQLYQTSLFSHQGVLVPRCYRFCWSIDQGALTASMVLEWCGYASDLDKDEQIRRKMLAACDLHRAGIHHGQLDNVNSRHFLFAVDGSVRIVDFAMAQLHACRKTYPVGVAGMMKSPEKGCEELETLDRSTQDPMKPSQSLEDHEMERSTMIITTLPPQPFINPTVRKAHVLHPLGLHAHHARLPGRRRAASFDSYLSQKSFSPRLAPNYS